MASAYLVEVLAIIDNLKLSPPEERILLNPDPLTDLYLAFAYYFPFVLYWGDWPFEGTTTAGKMCSG
ncbi:hypothetical protein [Thermococcus sp. JCM 11816]|uniref:hypothetical protein n=1 Tax=Thermococcus sp. (strain JCM 11816 / KS-1) TaxID=1295125 RepID=UPI0006D20828